jgi:hypothetical protein
LRSWAPCIAGAVALCNRYADQIEALATTHAVIRETGPADLGAILERFFAWSDEKAKRFSPVDVREAIEVLSRESLIDCELHGYVARTRWRQKSVDSRGDFDPLLY